MTQNRKWIAALGTVLAGLAALPSFAGGVTGAAREWTQLLNNAELLKIAADGAVTARKAIEQQILQSQQYALQQRDIAVLDARAAPGNAAAVESSQRNLQTFKSAIEALEGSLAQQVGAMERRLAEARLANQTWDEYVTSASREIDHGNKKAIARLQYEESLIQRVNDDYTFARKVQESVHGTIGSHQSLQMLNAQMNRVIAQNARMLEVMARTTVKDSADRKGEEAIARARRLEDEKRIGEDQRRVRERQQRFLQGQ